MIIGVIFVISIIAIIVIILSNLFHEASEGLVKTDRIGYDIYSGIADTKALFSKYCKPFEKRLRSLMPSHRVVPAGDGEDSATISVPGFVVDPKAQKKKTFAPQKVELQFLENHKARIGGAANAEPPVLSPAPEDGDEDDSISADSDAPNDIA
eukprot:CAMPEP_0172184080 /NCGR_PEP_ID=MMETSP1050-20130122/19367_1 /TAXON_ID=233186 /ORGANISM="Cryptomonas curvata, Strain CCAP979/52" /LENGTH=152 /DNA_ID=CAMNT_0012857819 /DNA_START=610 /DNA_END=1065 /DNA_ORIENTATION=-